MADQKKKSSVERLFARYKTHDGEDRGSPEQWRAVAASAIDPKLATHLAALGIATLPRTPEELKKARRKAISVAHPDKGGDTVRAAEINAAFDQLEKLITPAPSPATSPNTTRIVNPPRCTGTLPEILTEEPLTHRFTADHVGEPKMNGEREMLYIGFCPYGRRTGSTMLSRQKSKHDGLYGDKTDNVPHITGNLPETLKDTVLDGEIWSIDWSTTRSIMGSAADVAVEKQRTHKATYYVFDMPVHKGKDIRKLPYTERRRLLEEVVREIANPHVQVIEQIPYTDIDRRFMQIVAAGGEGIVVKNRHAGYGEAWAKYKKAADVSAFIIGYVEGKKAFAGMIGSVQLGVYRDGKVVSVGHAGGFTSALRRDITENRQAYLGRVLDVFAFEITKAGQLSNATYHRFRDDINKEDCTYDKVLSDLNNTRGNRTKED